MSEIKSKLPPIVDRWLLMPANKLSKHIKDGSLTSVKLCELYIERIKQVNPHINGMAEDRFKEALLEAQQIDQLLSKFRSGKQESEFSSDELDKIHSPFVGVPVSVKESIKLKGMVNSSGIWRKRNARAAKSAIAIDNVIRFGMIPICTTNVPEGTMYWADCNNLVYGRSKNPYDHSRITGASSGGEGTLLGAGGSVIGIGSDAGGSVRIPAHYCGIFSLKPTSFLCNMEGNQPNFPPTWLKISTFGPMCRYASDLRPLFKCLISDKNNPRQDIYHDYQPENIGEMRKIVLQKLDEKVDLTKIKIFYFNFNESSKLVGKQSVRVQDEIMDSQKEVLEHFRSKFNCQTEEINLDKYIKKTLITWFSVLCHGGETDDSDFESLTQTFKNALKVDSFSLELVKFFLGMSKHTKESVLTGILTRIPDDEEEARKMVNEFRKFATDLKAEMEATLGDSGILIVPTLPTVAYKHGQALFKTPDLRFPAMFNILRLPVSHSTMRLDKKDGLPFGFSAAAKEYNDHLTLAIAEEMELAFGGWRQPTVSPDVRLPDRIDELLEAGEVNSATENNKQ